MVSLATLIVNNFRDVAYCRGNEQKSASFPKELLIAGANGVNAKPLGSFKGKKLIAFISNDCPVSMVETVIKARQFVEQKKDVQVIVAPLQRLSGKHLAMKKMVRNGNMLFFNDETWRTNNPAKVIELPLFVWIEDLL